MRWRFLINVKAYFDLARTLIEAIVYEVCRTVFTIKNLEKCDGTFFLTHMYAPESTTVVLSQRMQQWQRAILIRFEIMNSAELSWCRVFRKGSHRPMHSNV